MESSANFNFFAEIAIWLLIACTAAYVAWSFRKSLFTNRKIMLALAATMPWLMVSWFLLAVAGCFAAVSSIGSGSTDIPLFLQIGGFGFPVFLPLSIYLRKLIRKHFSSVDERQARPGPEDMDSN